MNFSDAQLQAWLQGAMWPFLRITGLVMVAPLIGDKSTPVRIRLVLSLMLTVVLLPLLPVRMLTPSLPHYAKLSQSS